MYSHYSGHLKPKCVSHFDQTSEESVSETGPQTTEDCVLETGPKQLIEDSVHETGPKQLTGQCP